LGDAHPLLLLLLLQGKADAKKAKVYGRIGKKLIQM
jgi:hypothetical protein